MYHKEVSTKRRVPANCCPSTRDAREYVRARMLYHRSIQYHWTWEITQVILDISQTTYHWYVWYYCNQESKPPPTRWRHQARDQAPYWSVTLWEHGSAMEVGLNRNSPRWRTAAVRTAPNKWASWGDEWHTFKRITANCLPHVSFLVWSSRWKFRVKRLLLINGWHLLHITAL